MFDTTGDSWPNPLGDELTRRAGMLDLDELVILRRLHGKLDVAQVDRRDRISARVCGFVW